MWITEDLDLVYEGDMRGDSWDSEVSNMKLMDFMEMMDELEIETNKSIDHGFISQIKEKFEDVLLEKRFGNES